MRLQSVVDYLVYLFVRVLICVAQALPMDVCRKIAKGLAWLLCDVLKLRHKVVDENLHFAFPELSEKERGRLELRMWEHLLVLVLEVAHTPRKIHETNWRDFVHLENEAALVRMLLEDRPLLIVTGHLGNFEVGGYVLGILGFPTYSVARTLDNPYLDRFVNEFRGRTGQHLIPKNGGFDQIEHVLSDNGAMGLLADQYAGPKGCWIQFFNRPASAHKAIALLALEHNAPMAVCASLRLGDEPMIFNFITHDVFDPASPPDELGSVKAITQWYNDRLTDLILRAPEQYWWIHRRWKDTREPKKTAKKAAA